MVNKIRERNADKSANLNIINASEGHYLTQADNSISISDRIVTTRVYLAINDSLDSWKEIDREEAKEIEEAKKQSIININ